MNPRQDSPTEERRKETEIRHMSELLQELRVILPGVQVTFAFLLTVAFMDRFTETTALQRSVYFAALLSTALATAFLIAGTVLLAIGMSCVIFLVADVVYGRTGAIVATTTMVGVFVGLWYLFPLYRRMRN